jgi:multicomponent Na+:H+ antiporter subunit G
MMIEIIVGCILIVGALFALLAAVGMVRFPDLYTRMHAASKAGTLGSGLMLLALALYSAEFSVVSRALAGIVFFLLTTPVAAHLLARAAYVTGTKPWPGTVIDEYKDHCKAEKD